MDDVISSMTRAEAKQALAAVRAERKRREDKARADRERKHARRAERSLLAYCEWMIPGFIVSPFAEHLCAQLERASLAYHRGEVLRLVLEVPPQHGKTTILTCWMLWHARRYGGPMAYGTYSADRAAAVSKTTQRMASTAAHQWEALTRAKHAQQLVADWSTQRSQLRWVGRGGPLTGSPASIMVIDDPYKNQEEAYSPAIRREVDGWWRSTVSSRLTEAHVVVILHTRWHELDLIGEIKRRDEAGTEGWPWEVVSYPALAEGHDDLGREPGEALVPGLKSADFLRRQRATVGERVFAALWQQSPTTEDGIVFQRSDFEARYGHDPRRPVVAYDRIVVSIDANFESGEDNDRTAIEVWGDLQEANLLDVLDVVANDPMDFPELRRAALDAVASWQPHVVLIEKKANGAALISTLEREIAAYCRRHGIRVPAVVPFEPGQRSKAARAQVASMWWRTSRCRLPEAAPWVPAFIEQHVGFGSGAAYDDLVDAGVQVVLWAREAEEDQADPMETARRLAALS